VGGVWLWLRLGKRESCAGHLHRQWGWGMGDRS